MAPQPWHPGRCRHMATRPSPRPSLSLPHHLRPFLVLPRLSPRLTSTAYPQPSRYPLLAAPRHHPRRRPAPHPHRQTGQGACPADSSGTRAPEYVMANESYKDKRNTIGRLNLDRSGLRILLLPMVAGFHLGISLIKRKASSDRCSSGLRSI